jgi:hypothetical protein
MLKPDKNFRLHKQYKRRIALMKCSDEVRHLWKKTFIQAQLAEEDFRKSKFKDKGE